MVFCDSSQKQKAQLITVNGMQKVSLYGCRHHRQAEEDTPKQENDIGYRIIKIPLGHCIHSDSTNVNYQNGNHSHYKQQRFKACHKGRAL